MEGLSEITNNNSGGRQGGGSPGEQGRERAGSERTRGRQRDLYGGGKREQK